jgi:hypothetical protein
MNAWKTAIITCLSLVALGVAPAGAAPPRVTVKAATPSSAYQGESLEVVVSGSGFDASAKVQFFVSGTTNPGGITVQKVMYANSGELVTTINVAGTASPADFDIQVTLDNGRKGKGTTLFKVNTKPSPSDPPPAPTYPAARFWHAFASNGGTTAATSRLYMFAGAGGAQVEWQDLSDLWVYTNAGSSGAKWTFISPGSTAPGPRHHGAWSCGGGYCVASGGVPRYDETWVFSESSASWTQLNCSRRVACPPRRWAAAMAYDPSHGSHLLFGGEYNGTLADTWSFSTGAMKWTKHGSGSVPAARYWAAAAFVPLIDNVVLFGGFDVYADVFNDMYFWDGSAWVPVAQVVDGTLAAVPTLMNHSMAWDPIGNRLVVTGGLKDRNDTPSTDTFYVTFTPLGAGWRASWTRASGIGCQSTAGSSDSTIYPQARMAFDIPSGVQVLFGGGQNLADVGAWAYDNTVECR